MALGPVVADRELGGSDAWAATISAFGVGSLIGSAVSLRVRPRRPMLASMAGFVLASCQPAVVALGGSVAVVCAGLLVCGISTSVGFLQWETTLGREIPEHALSRVTSLDYFVSMALMPLGLALVGPLSDAAGLHPTMVAAAVLSAAVAAAAAASPAARGLQPKGPSPSLR